MSRSVRQQPFASVSVLSLILCLATVGLLLTHQNELIEWGSVPITEYPGYLSAYRILLYDGTVHIERWYPFIVRYSAPIPRRRFELYGLAIDRGYENFSPDGAGPYDAYACVIELPVAWLTLATAAPPACWLWFSIRMHSKIRPGFCTRCGYDLRGSPERCPECGTEVVHAAKQ